MCETVRKFGRRSGDIPMTNNERPETQQTCLFDDESDEEVQTTEGGTLMIDAGRQTTLTLPKPVVPNLG